MITVDCEKSQPIYGEIAAATFTALSLSGEAVVELDFVTEDEIRGLNRTRRGVDAVTDVLSFPLLDRIESFDEKNYPFDFDHASGRVDLGNVVVCEAVAERQASEYGHGADREKGYLFLHGLLHLLGYDHIEPSDYAEMREAEEKILASVGLTRD